MSNQSNKLEKQADLLFGNVAGWEKNALKRIGRRVKEIKSLSYADLQALNNATIVKQDINIILNELAELTKQNAVEVEQIYSEMIDKQHNDNKVLYDYRNKKFIPYEDNKQLQSIVKAHARTTAETMVNLSMTKARQLGTVDINGKFVPLEKKFKNVLDKAIMSITTGTGDFNSEMRSVLTQLGSSGIRVDYGGGVTRRLDTMVRQNLLWGAKQASVEYNEMIGEELNCDGIEIDWHSNPRPSHEFMQGKQYSLNGKKTVNGVTYESADKALDALMDYGCLHFKTPIILGVSEPRYSSEELKRLNEENKCRFDIDGKQLSGYQCKQGMRRLELEARKTRDQIDILKASGDNIGVNQLKTKLGMIEDKYKKISDKTGMKPQWQRMSVVKSKSVDTMQGMSYNITVEREQFDRYKKTLKELAPQSFEEFLNIKIAHPDEWNTLKYQYRTLNRYDVEGAVSSKTILLLDNAAWYTKQKAFDYKMYSGKVRKEIRALSNQGNAASMLFDGQIYFAHSRVSNPSEMAFLAYKGEYPIITLKENRRFSVKDLGDGVPRHHDTEAKFLEFIADKKEYSDTFTVTILSEKHMCESCAGVVEQFKNLFPNSTVNIISGKKNYNKSPDGLKTWVHRKKVR